MLRQIRDAQIDLDSVRKVSVAAFGLALWLNALAEYSHHSGLMRKAKFIPTATKNKNGGAGAPGGDKQIWQYSTNTHELNEEVLMRMPKWSREN